MYIGSDGRVYQNKFESLGHGTKVPGYADEQYAINQRLGELRRQQQEYAGQQQQQALNQQQIDQNDLNQFYDRQQRFAAIHGQPYGFGQMPQSSQPGNGMGARQSPQGGQAGYGMPMERRETVQSPLTQDAGKLNRMLQKYHQGRTHGMQRTPSSLSTSTPASRPVTSAVSASITATAMKTRWSACSVTMAIR